MKNKFLHEIKQGYIEPDVDIDVDQIWENVEQRIDNKKYNRWFIFIIIGLTICAISLILFSTQKNDSSIQTVLNNDQFNNSTNKVDNDTFRALTNKDSKNESSMTLLNHKTVIPTSLHHGGVALMHEQKTYSSTNSNNSVINPNTSASINSSLKMRTAIEEKDVQPNNLETPNLTNIDKIATLAPTLFKLEKKLVSIVNFDQKTKKNNILMRPLTFELQVGVSLFIDQLKASSPANEQLVQLRNSHSKALESINFTGLISYNFNKTSSIKTGIDIRQFTSQFVYDHVYLENIELIGVDTLIITGPGPNDFVEISSTKNFSRIIQRQVTHYNQQTFINIPLFVSITLDQLTVKPQFVFGPIFNIKTSLNGLTVDQNTMVLNFDENDFKSSFGVGGFMGVNSSYSFTKHLDCLFGAQFNYYPNIKYDTQKYSQSLFSYGLNLGVKYKM